MQSSPDTPSVLVLRSKGVLKWHRWRIRQITALIIIGIGLIILISLLFPIYWLTPYQIDLILGSAILLGGGLSVTLFILTRTSIHHHPPVSTYIPLQTRDSRPPLPVVRAPPRHPKKQKKRSPFIPGGRYQKHLRTRYRRQAVESAKGE